MRRKKKAVGIWRRKIKDGKNSMGEDAGRVDMKRKVCVFQMVLWVSVIIFQMAVVESMEVRAEEIAGVWETGELPKPKELQKEGEGQEQIMVRSVMYQRKEECPEPEKIYIAEDGMAYSLLSWEMECVQVPIERHLVRKEGVCGPVEGIFQIPENTAIMDYEGWQQDEVACHLKEKAVVKEEWSGDFSFPITFHKYDAGVYWLQGQRITGNGEKPRLDGYEELLLKEIGVPPEEYQISDIVWDGEPYEDETEELCRDAVAYGQKLVRYYRLVYEGTAEFPAYEAWRTEAVYGIEEHEEEEAEAIQVVSAVTEIEETQQATAAFPALDRLWERITRTLLMAIGIGAALFFFSLAVMAVLWAIRFFRAGGRKGDR